jgi:hypothetical protein
MNDAIPPPPGVPTNGRAWFYAGPILIDCLALICTTILVAMRILPVESFKYLVGVLVVGNVALRVPGNKNLPPGGGGLIMTIASAALFAARHRS